MTKSSASYINNNSINASQYVTHQGVLSAQLNAVLPKTNDSGQIPNFSQAPTASARDYEVFRFSDSLQATAPIFIKASYAVDNTTFTYLNFTVGTSTNGSGTLGGVTTPSLPVYGYQPTATATRYCYASSDGSQLVFVANLQNVSATTGDSISAIIVERTRDADGTPNAFGYMVYQWRSTSEAPAVGTNSFVGCYARNNDVNAVQPAIVYDYGVAVPNLGNVTTYLVGSTAYSFPVYGFGNAMTGASKALMLGFAGDFPKESPVALTHYGTSMTFLPLPQVGAFVPYLSTASAAAIRTMSPLIRWE